MRIFAISDLHVDYDQNMRWIKNLSETEYSKDILIIAGDICDLLEKFDLAMDILSKRFANVFFVPGNHDLWIRRSEAKDSIEKFKQLLQVCQKYGINTTPKQFNIDEYSIGIVPLYSWYVKPEEGSDSLFLEKPGEDPALSMWVDNYAINWPDEINSKPADYFFKMNSSNGFSDYPEYIITFSHFLPRQELIFSLKHPVDTQGRKLKDPAPAFNFSRVAGSSIIDQQLRSLNANVHIYGHQHRNRFRKIEGVTYIAHGLGYPKERKYAGIEDNMYRPKLIWGKQNGFLNEEEY